MENHSIEAGSTPEHSLHLDKDIATGLVVANHYTGRSWRVVKYPFVWKRDGEPVAACLFGIPAARWKEDVLELVRLVKVPGCDSPLSSFISSCCQEVRRAGEYDLLVSYADSTHSHHGGIYQACSWNFDRTKPPSNDGLIIDGKFVPGRYCNNLYGTRSRDKVAKLLPNSTVEKHWDLGKHLYWKALNKSGKRKASRLGLKSNPYPKPEDSGN